MARLVRWALVSLAMLDIGMGVGYATVLIWALLRFGSREGPQGVIIPHGISPSQFFEG